MRIGIDGLMLRPTDGGFVSYFQALVQGMGALDCANYYHIYLAQELQNRFSGNCYSNMRFFPVATPRWCPRAISHQAFFAISLFKRDMEILHCTALVPLVSNIATIATVYDLTYMLYPKTMKRTGHLWWNLLMPLGIRKATQIITISQSTKNDLIRHYGIPSPKIHVIYPYVHPRFVESRATRSGLGLTLPSKYILYVGTIEPRKNIASLVDAFALIKVREHLDHYLVIVGKKGWAYQDVFKKVESLGLQRDIVFMGYIPDEQLPAVYAGADLFVYPSLYEGFGLPVLEAMACGVPVVASHSSSLPEVIGDAGILVPPSNVAEIASAIMRVVRDEGLREEMSQRSLLRAKELSRERFVGQTLQVYKEVLGD